MNFNLLTIKQLNIMKTQIYNLVILDKSGSMSSIANAAISGFNETVGGIRSAQERFNDTQEHFVSLMIFCDCEKRLVYDKVPVADVKELTSKDYRPCCCTPLYDAMGISINGLYNAIKDKEDATAVVTIITDGLENSSKEYSGKAIKALVESMKEKEGWSFAYIGANQDVNAVSQSLSIDDAIAFDYNEEGTRVAFERDNSARMRKFGLISSAFATTSGMTREERKSYRSKANKESSYFDEKDKE